MAPTLEQSDSSTAPHTAAAHQSVMAGVRTLSPSYHHADILQSVAAAKKLWIADPDRALNYPVDFGRSLLFVPSKSPLEDLIRSAIPVPRPVRSPPRKHKSLRLTPKQRVAQRAERVKRADSEERLRNCDRFRLLRQWTGAVTSVGSTSFQGVGTTPDSRNRAERHELDIPYALVRPSDRPLVSEGALFYLCVGQFFRDETVTPGALVWFRRRRTIDDGDRLLDAAERSLARVAWTS